MLVFGLTANIRSLNSFVRENVFQIEHKKFKAFLLKKNTTLRVISNKTLAMIRTNKEINLHNPLSKY